MCLALGHRVAGAGKAGGGARGPARVKAFPGTASQRHLAHPQGTALGVDRSEATAALTTVAHRRLDARMKPQVERGVGQKRWGARQGPLGTPSAVEEPPGHRHAGGERFLVMDP